MPRLLRLFDRLAIRSTWFIPGPLHRDVPRQRQQVVAGRARDRRARLLAREPDRDCAPSRSAPSWKRSIELIERLTGQRPRGYVAPWWEMSERTAALLLEYGFSYDRTQIFHDFQPFYARIGDSGRRSTTRSPRTTWMRPLVRGREIDLVESAATGTWTTCRR